MGAPVILAILGIASNYCKMVFLFVPLPPVQTAFVSVTVTIGNGAYSILKFPWVLYTLFSVLSSVLFLIYKFTECKNLHIAILSTTFYNFFITFLI
jgi:hypothetical protein